VLRHLLAVAAALLAAPAEAQTVTSAAPDAVAVTVYRAPDAGGSSTIDFDWLTGYALITEKRTLTIPAGRAVIRFEGVAGGMLPESAIVSGLPAGVREKNLDADLLSPRSLYARSYGRPVTIRRTIRGRSVEERAIIRSGPDGAAILQTREGFIAANCGPSDDTLLYDSVPQGLAPKPTLSVQSDSPGEARVTLTLSYLAWNFDWRANYVATMRPDGKSADLLAWVTLANGDVTGFPNAEAMVVAGRLNREDERGYSGRGGGALSFSCFSRPLPAPMPAPSMLMRRGVVTVADAIETIGAEEIVVSGARIARQEELGDLKLYRIPDATTVASMSQKQVMMFQKPAVPVDVLYRTRIQYGDNINGVMLALRAQNRKEKGLGIPLPSGGVVVFQPRGGSRLLIGEGSIDDKAINEEVQFDIAEATQVTATVKGNGDGDDWEDEILTVTNANPYAIRFEAEFEDGVGYRRTRSSARLIRKNGRDVWAVEVPANGTATLRYRKVDIDRD